MTTIEGTVKSVGSFKPQTDAASGLRLKVDTKDGQSVTVYGGPKDFAMDQGLKIKRGDRISITGSKTKVDQKTAIMASEIEGRGKTIKLRDKNGTPQWQKFLQGKTEHEKMKEEKKEKSYRQQEEYEYEY